MTHEEAILNGNFDCALLDKSKYEAQIKDIIKISVENIYQSTEVVDKEIAGYGVINTLLNTYTTAVNNCFNNMFYIIVLHIVLIIVLHNCVYNLFETMCSHNCL